MAAEVARAAGVALPEGFAARQLRPDVDIVHYDLVCVMDKFTAADVLREVRGGEPRARANVLYGGGPCKVPRGAHVDAWHVMHNRIEGAGQQCIGLIWCCAMLSFSFAAAAMV